MRFAIRSTLLLLVPWLAASALLWWLVERSARDEAWELMKQSAHVIGQEVSLEFNDRLVEDLAQGSKIGRAELRRTIGSLELEGAEIRSAVLIDDAGPVLVSGDGSTFPAVPYRRPRDLFGSDKRLRLVGRDDALGPGTFLVDVPLLRAGEPVAYLRLLLRSEPIARLLVGARRLAIALSGAGLAGVVLFGLLLQRGLAQRDRAVRDALAHALDGGTGAPLDPGLGPAVTAARSAGERLREEHAQRLRSEGHLRALETALEGGILLADPRGRIEFAGETARAILGWPAGEVASRWDQLRPRLAAALDTAAAGRAPDVLRVDAGPGAVHAVVVEVLPLGADAPAGAPSPVLIMVREERTADALETDLRAAAQLRSMSRIYLGVAHDLRAPVNALLLNLELLKRSLLSDEDVDPVLLARRQQWVHVIEEELARLGRSLDVVLAQTAPPRRVVESFDLREVVAQVERLLGAQSRQLRVQLRAVLPDEPTLVIGERDAVKQAIIHLAVNALESFPEPRGGGEARTVTLELQRESAQARVLVSDNGPGIDDAVRSRLFGRHVTTKPGGSGIGLHVARRVAVACGGSLRLVDSGREGTTFELALPAAASAEPA